MFVDLKDLCKKKKYVYIVALGGAKPVCREADNVGWLIVIIDFFIIINYRFVSALFNHFLVGQCDWLIDIHIMV